MRLGLSIDDFYDLTPLEFKYAIKILADTEIDVFKTRFEVARYMAFHIWNSAGRSLKHLYKDPKEVGLFGWEGEDTLNKKQSVEEIKQGLLSLLVGKLKQK